MEPFLGQIIMFGGNFAPRGWALCDGQLLPIRSHSALFSIFGTTYGGDGRSTFALPDLRGRVPIHAGRGPGLSDYKQGQKGGSETNTLTEANLPPHSHALQGSTNPGNTPNPTGATLGQSGSSAPPTGIYSSSSPNTTLHSGSVGNASGGQRVNNVQPYLSVNFIIALQGTYPSRS